MYLIQESTIKDYITVCPYCMNEYRGRLVCCGESSDHAQEALVTTDNECHLLSEVEIIHDN